MPSSPPYFLELPTVWLVFLNRTIAGFEFFQHSLGKKKARDEPVFFDGSRPRLWLAGNRITAPLPSGFRALGRGLVAVGARGSRRLALRAEARSREP